MTQKFNVVETDRVDDADEVRWRPRLVADPLGGDNNNCKLGIQFYARLCSLEQLTGEPLLYSIRLTYLTTLKLAFEPAVQSLAEWGKI